MTYIDNYMTYVDAHVSHRVRTVGSRSVHGSLLYRMTSARRADLPTSRGDNDLVGEHISSIRLMKV